MPSTSLAFTSRDQHRAWLAAQAALPAGFRTGTARFEFTPREAPKPAKMTLTLLALDRPTPDFAAMFTRNAFPGAPVIVGRRRLAEPTLGAIIINNKISNVCAPGGVEASERICAATAKLLNLAPSQVLPSSTGVIGWGLPVDAMLGALPATASAEDIQTGLYDVARAEPLFAKLAARTTHFGGAGSGQTVKLINQIFCATHFFAVAEAVRFAEQHGLLLISIADLIRYRRHAEKLVKRVSEARIPTQHGEFTAYVYESILDGTEHVAFTMGDVSGAGNVLVRVHSECLTGDIFGSMRCDCGPQLDGALARIAADGTGVLVYLRGHEGRGIGLGHKLRAYSLQDQGRDTVEANVELGLPVDSREYGIGSQILVDLGITTMRLMTNNPSKYGGLEGYGLEIVERVPLEVEPNAENIAYLRAKAEKMGHMLDLESGADGGAV